MSFHRSLISSSKYKRHRSVLKRFERVEKLHKEGRWKEEDSVFGLPKVKMIKIKFRKIKAAEAPAAGGAEAGTAAAPGAEAAAGEAKTKSPGETRVKTVEEKRGK